MIAIREVGMEVRPLSDPTKCDYCGRQPSLKALRCGSCKKTYRGRFCTICKQALAKQDYCMGNTLEWETEGLSFKMLNNTPIRNGSVASNAI